MGTPDLRPSLKILARQVYLSRVLLFPRKHSAQFVTEVEAYGKAKPELSIHCRITGGFMIGDDKAGHDYVRCEMPFDSKDVFHEFFMGFCLKTDLHWNYPRDLPSLPLPWIGTPTASQIKQMSFQISIALQLQIPLVHIPELQDEILKRFDFLLEESPNHAAQDRFVLIPELGEAEFRRLLLGYCEKRQLAFEASFHAS